MSKITNIFYDEIIKEAGIGRIDADRYLNIKFNTKLLGITSIDNDNYSPTLVISDFKKFDDKLEEYASNALSFYDEQQYEELSKAPKTIMASIWSNANPDDFANPVQFLDRAIDFINDDTLSNYFNPTNIGYSKILDSNIEVLVVKNNFLKESPYSVKITLVDITNKNLRYDLPVVSYGISNNKAYIYAIKGKSKYIRDLEKADNSDEQNNHTDKLEKIMRTTTKQNFKDPSKSRDDISSPEHLSGIMPWHLLSATIALGLFKKMNIEDVLISDYMFLVRYNAKDKANQLRSTNDESFDEEKYNNLKERQESDLRNTTDKLLRIFRRLDYHFKNLDILLYPQEVDNFMHMKLTNDISCNNDILNEFYLLSLSDFKNNIKK